MAIAITDDHQELADVARSVATDRDCLGAARTTTDDVSAGRPLTTRATKLWKEISSLGWLGLHIEEEFGGQGFGLAEVAVVAEALGRAVAPGAFLPTVIASAVIAEHGSTEEKQRWLPGLADGSLTAGVALATSPKDTGVSLLLSGENPELLLVADGADLVVLADVDPDTLPAHTPIDRTRLLLEVGLEDRSPVARLVGGVELARRVGLTLAAAEAVGGLEACTELSVRYAMTREQFGRAIGSYQAIKHHCANMLVDTQVSAALAWDAARAGTADEWRLSAAAAATYALPAYKRVAEMTIQVHGGIGYTWEHDAHLYLRRATALASLFEAPHVTAEEVLRLQQAGVSRAARPELPPEAEAYRAAVREFLAANRALPDGERMVHFARSGYVVPHWPKPFGRGASPVEQLVIDEELASVERTELGLGGWVLPTILQHGTEEQRDRVLWPSLEGKQRWCQLFSEPGAGSDAAAVTTRAVRTDGGWLVTGQKVWTSDARNCTHGLATIRTGPDKHRGITAMMIDMSSPGLEVRPLVEITGEALFNEVFFDNVFVPDDNVLGEVNNGWRVAMATLGNERVSIGGGAVTIEADALLGSLERNSPGDLAFAREVGQLLSEKHGLAMTNLRLAERAVADADPGPEANLMKVFQSEHAQRIVQLGMRIAGTATLIGEEEKLFHDFLFTRCLTIAGGTSEIIRNSVAERILSLPREPSIQPQEKK